jgi:hypothetical protein
MLAANSSLRPRQPYDFSPWIANAVAVTSLDSIGGRGMPVIQRPSDAWVVTR